MLSLFSSANSPVPIDARAFTLSLVWAMRRRFKVLPHVYKTDPIFFDINLEIKTGRFDPLKELIAIFDHKAGPRINT